VQHLLFGRLNGNALLLQTDVVLHGVAYAVFQCPLVGLGKEHGGQGKEYA
jgi:hypothetical protein